MHVFWESLTSANNVALITCSNSEIDLRITKNFPSKGMNIPLNGISNTGAIEEINERQRPLV